MLTQLQKNEMNREFSILVSANLKKDGTPKKKANPTALLRIAELLQIERANSRAEAEARKERELAFIQDSGFSIGQKVKFTVLGQEETGIVTACVNMPCQLNSGLLAGQIGVSIAGSAPYMFRPEELTIA